MRVLQRHSFISTSAFIRQVTSIPGGGIPIRENFAVVLGDRDAAHNPGIKIAFTRNPGLEAFRDWNSQSKHYRLFAFL